MVLNFLCKLGEPHSADSRFGVWIVIDQVDVRNERHNVFIIQVVLGAKENQHVTNPTTLGFFKDFFQNGLESYGRMKPVWVKQNAESTCRKF